MNKLIIAQTETTPHVSFDHLLSTLEIKGEISPENAKDFFAPIFSWCDELYDYMHYVNSISATKKDLNFIIHIDYITSGSLKCIYDLFKKLIRLKPYFSNVKVTWLYDAEDDDMKENGEEFSTMLDLPFDIKPA